MTWMLHTATVQLAHRSYRPALSCMEMRNLLLCLCVLCIDSISCLSHCSHWYKLWLHTFPFKIEIKCWSNALEIQFMDHCLDVRKGLGWVLIPSPKFPLHCSSGSIKDEEIHTRQRMTVWYGVYLKYASMTVERSVPWREAGLRVFFFF